MFPIDRPGRGSRWPTDDFVRAVELYQSILGDDQMRVSPLTDPQSGSIVQAGVLAERAMDEILDKREGRAAYQKYEQIAADKLTQATPIRMRGQCWPSRGPIPVHRFAAML